MDEKVTLSLQGKKVTSSDFDYLLGSIPESQRNEIQSLMNDIKRNSIPPEKNIKLEDLIKMEAQENFDPASLVVFENGVFLGIVLTFTKQSEIEKIMSEYSSSVVLNNNIKRFSSLLYYKDLDISFCFDEKKVVQEMTFGKNFLGKTLKGLKIGSAIEKSIDIYGIPKFSENSNVKSLRWGDLLIMTDGVVITHIRLSRTGLA